MNRNRINGALAQLAVATRELAQFCAIEVPEFAGAWLRISKNALALQDDLNQDDLAYFNRSFTDMFAYHHFSFTEAYVQRSNVDEMRVANAEFDKMKDRVVNAFGELQNALDSKAY